MSRDALVVGINKYPFLKDSATGNYKHLTTPANDSLQETPCPIWGSQKFLWGRTVGESASQWVYFRADGAGWGEGEKLRMRKCLDCRNVQLFTYD